MQIVYKKGTMTSVCEYNLVPVINCDTLVTLVAVVFVT